ncbi:hypothetical protein ES703_105672 [subsurface metagenome]
MEPKKKKHSHKWGITKRYGPGSYKAYCRGCRQSKRVTRLGPGRYLHVYLATGAERILTKSLPIAKVD